jgi:hypothetical protein
MQIDLVVRNSGAGQKVYRLEGSTLELPYDDRKVAEQSRLAATKNRCAHCGADAPTAVRSVSRLGLGHQGWLGSDRCANAAQERDGVLRAHSSGAPPNDGPHSASFGEVTDVSFTGSRLGAQESANTLGRERNKGLGLRNIEAEVRQAKYSVTELNLNGG